VLLLLGKVIMVLENSKENGMFVLVAVQCIGVYTVFFSRIQRIDGMDIYVMDYG